MAAEPSIHVLFEPAARPHADLAGVTAVVIDAVRATTTVVAALAAGCVEVLPFRTAEEVLAEAARRPPGTVVTAGERLGVRIDGLDLNNSPSVMTPDTVAGRTLLLTTTNGTAAVLDALAARDVLVAAMPNRAAVARRCAALGRRVVFVTAGTVGTVSCEDTLVAGAVIDAMSAAPGGGAFHLADSARTALLAWLGARDCLADVLHRTWGGAFIARLGLDADLAACAALDTSAIVPVAHAMPTRITAS